ncbi:MAG: hypothetical protein R3B47_16945 [Bacteroidia bacterium]
MQLQKNHNYNFQGNSFPGILQEVVILLCENKTDSFIENTEIRQIELQNSNDLVDLDLNKYGFHPVTNSIQNGHKWTSLFIDEARLNILQKVVEKNDVSFLGHFASVNVGIVTGRNDFFVLQKSQVRSQNLFEFVSPIIGKTSALKKTEFNHLDFANYSNDFPSYLLDLHGINDEAFSPELVNYLEIGEEEHVHEGYKCRIRKRWYVVPSAHKSDGFLFRQIYKHPLLVNNSANAACTDTIHRVILKAESKLSMEALSLAFVNSLTFAYSELIGRSYGGGVLELEPREALMLPIPTTNISAINKDLVNEYLMNQEIEAALDYTDNILLIDGLGLNRNQVSKIRSVWHTLRDRRLGRG